MGTEGYITIILVACTIGALIFSQVAHDIILLCCLTLLMVVPVPIDTGWKMGVISMSDGLSGFSNPGMMTVAVLFVVVAGVSETGGLDWITRKILGHPKSIREAHIRLSIPVAFLSAFLNNTPIVSMMIAPVCDWAKRTKISPSKLLIPLSHATVLGGLCTLIGTSTNLVIAGLALAYKNPIALKMFDVAWVGVPCTVVGVAFIVLLGNKLLPERKAAISNFENPREYTVEMLVTADGPLVGKTVEQAGLRHLPGLYLVEIDRGACFGRCAPATGDETLCEMDRLIFVGMIDSVKDLQKIRGLTPATTQIFKLDGPRGQRCLIEAVVSNTCPLVGRSIREGRFRTTYDAAVIAVARNAERITAKVGDIVLQTGDTLLLEAHPDFVERQKNSRDFFLISPLENSAPARHEKGWLSLAILLIMVLSSATGSFDILFAGLLAAGLMIVFRCCSVATARASFDYPTLAAIAASLGISKAIDKSGAAEVLASTAINALGSSPVLGLIVLYWVTVLLTELLSNNACAALIFPIAMATAQKYGANPMPFLMAVMIGSSAGFATPFGYQTNLMVYGPGGYRFSDYIKIGIPLGIVVGITAIVSILLKWPF